MTIGLTWRRTARRIKRLNETVLAISPDYSDRPTPDFLALSPSPAESSSLTNLQRDCKAEKGLLTLIGRSNKMRSRFPSNPLSECTPSITPHFIVLGIWKGFGIE
jgi:hypothetical protein